MKKSLLFGLALAVLALVAAPALAADNPQRTIHVYAYDELPTCDSTVDGRLAVVNDADYPFLLGNGGGTETVLVQCADAAWEVKASGGYIGGSAAVPVACSASIAGATYLDTTASQFCYCNGTSWLEVDDATTACA